jgi:hypothetical protein
MRLTPFFAVSMASLLIFVAMLINASSNGWLIAAPMPFTAALMLRACWHAGGSIALADQVMTRVLLDAGAVPHGTPATQVAARIAASDARLGRPPLRLLDRSLSLNAATTLPPTASTARHAS